MKKLLTITIIIIFLAVIGGGVYYYFFYTKIPPTTNNGAVKTIDQPGFSPFENTNSNTNTGNNSNNTETSTTTVVQENNDVGIAKLRRLSQAPVAGFVTISTASSSIVRFIDRGTGHVYEANSLSNNIDKISNTTIPKIYESYGNKSASAFIIRYLQNDSDTITNFYAELRSTGSSTGETAFQFKGKYLSPDIDQIAVSPAGDRIFTWNIENNNGIGYISSFDEKNRIKIADIPLRQVNLDWPEINTVTLSTKASGVSSGYMYSINTKSGAVDSILGPIKGLFGKASKDFTKVLYSAKSGDSFSILLLNTKSNQSQEQVFRTLADKCVWSSLRKDEVYCAVPTEIPSGVYPDDWYSGKVSFVDQIWYLNTTTGEVHLIANLLKLSNNLIDATELTLDPNNDNLYFINKSDLNLWALDLNQ